MSSSRDALTLYKEQIEGLPEAVIPSKEKKKLLTDISDAISMIGNDSKHAELVLILQELKLRMDGIVMANKAKPKLDATLASTNQTIAEDMQRAEILKANRFTFAKVPVHKEKRSFFSSMFCCFPCCGKDKEEDNRSTYSNPAPASNSERASFLTRK